MRFSKVWNTIRDRLRNDVCVINCELKSGKHFKIKLLKKEGREQIANLIDAQGWTGFEYPMPILFTACVDKFKGTILDVGANVGYYSILAASGNGSNVIAFEPFSPVTDMLRENVEINGLTKQVKIEQVAVSDKYGEGVLYIPDDSHGLIETSASLDGQFKEVIKDEVNVKLMRLDELVNEIENVSVIKIDVEGNEKAVLDGAEKIILKNRPLIFIEILDRADCAGYQKYVQKIDYVDLRLKYKDVIQAEFVIFDKDAWNHLWVPKEKIATVEEIVEMEGLSWIQEREGEK